MRNLYLLYFFLIPFYHVFQFEMPFAFISTFIAIFGVFYHMTTSNKVNIHYFNKWTQLLLFMFIYNLLVALFSYSSWGVINGETTLDCIFGTSMWIITIGLSLYFNYICLSKYVIIDDLVKILKTQNYFLISIAFIQLAIIYGLGGPFIGIYDAISSITCIVDSSFLLYVNRGVCLYSSEPSYVSYILFYTVPFALMYELKKKWKPMTILWIIILALSGSSLVLVSFLVILCCYILLLTKNKIYNLVYIGSFFTGLLLALFYTISEGITTNIQPGTLSYVIWGKALNFEDYSTMARESTVINDMKIFLSYPLTGVGDGIQGMLYNQNIPEWTKNSIEVQDMMAGIKGVINGGGNFFPAYISGYGIIGILFLNIFIKKYIKDIKMLNRSFFWKNIYAMGIILFLITGWQTVPIYNNEYMMFLLSMPYMFLNNNNKYLVSSC